MNVSGQKYIACARMSTETEPVTAEENHLLSVLYTEFPIMTLNRNDAGQVGRTPPK